MKSPIKILIVEDEIWEVRYIQIILRDLGYEFCESAATGEKAIAQSMQENPDIILMDIRLIGGMDGIEAAREILAQQYIPIIFMTGYAFQDMRERAMALKPAAFLEKPVAREAIKSIVDTLFGEEENSTIKK
jgi:CheY-like chemotaxis protein